MLEAAFVGAIAKGTVFGKVASAKCHGGASLQVEFVPFSIDDLEVAFNPKGTVVVDFDGS